MLMVCVLHVTHFSGLIDTAEPTLYKALSCIVVTPCLIAVNLYALLTGYLCINKGWNINRYLELWITVCFYSFVLTSTCSGFNHIFGLRSSLRLINPYSSFYWYFAAYSGLFVTIPYLNKGLRALPAQNYRHLILLLITTYSLLSCWQPDYMAQSGHNAIWLIILYIVGGYIKLHPVSIKPWKLLCIYLTCCVVNYIVLLTHSKYLHELCWQNSSITLTIAGIAAFLLMINIQIRSHKLRKTLKWAAPMAFGVYLIHCHPSMWFIIKKHVHHLIEETGPCWWLIPLVSIAIYAAGTIIDWVRILIFSWLRIDRLTAFLTDKLPKHIKEL